MHNGQVFLGTGEVGRDGLKEMSSDDLSRNRDRNILPRFFTLQVKTTEADGSAAGFREVEYLELLIPGDSKSSPVHLVDDRLRERYSAHYKAFKENREMPTEGTPIEVWLGANDPRVHMLRSLHIRTVEHVSEMSDTTLAQIGIGGREMRSRAQAFLEAQQTAGVADKLAAKDDLIADLTERLKKLEAKESNSEEEEEEESDVRVPHGASAVSASKAPARRSSGRGK